MNYAATRSSVALSALALGLLLSAPGTARAKQACDEMPTDDVVVAEEEVVQQECDEGPNLGRVSIAAGIDWSSAYFFRGILQERHGFILWPYATLTIKLWENEAGQNFTFNVGTWNSIQDNKTLASGSGPSNWYESDVIVGVGSTLTDWLSASLNYIAYTYPNGAFATVQELDLGVTLNDSEWLGAFALYPSMTWAFELDRTALGNDEGIYLQLGVSPSYTAFSESDYPVTFSLPLTVGLSVSDYYEVLNDDGQVVSNDTFGYFDFGLGISVPLSFIPPKYGAWAAKGTIHGIYLSDDLAGFNYGDDLYPWGTVGISMSY